MDWIDDLIVFGFFLAAAGVVVFLVRAMLWAIITHGLFVFSGALALIGVLLMASGFTIENYA